MPEHFRVTYATLSADNEDLQAAYDEGIRVARSWFGADTTRVCQRTAANRRRRVRRREPCRPGSAVPRARGHDR